MKKFEVWKEKNSEAHDKNKTIAEQAMKAAEQARK